MILVALVACGAEVFDATTPRGGDDRADTASPDDTADSGDTHDSSSPSDLQALLDALRADRDAALQDVSDAGGWPAAVDGGRLFVCDRSGAWSLAGDFDAWAGEPMHEEDDFSWLVVAGATGGYKFTDGARWLADPWSRRYTYDDFGEMSLVTADSAHLERLFAVAGDALEPRTVRAWVPTGTATHALYMHDGQNLFDPEAPGGGWRVQDSAPAGMLVVGIDNTADRIDEYTHVSDVYEGVTYGGRADEYAAFVRDVVRPRVAATWGEPATVGTLGSSLGGLVSLYLADRDPDDWDFAASMSGTVGWGSIGEHNPTIIERYASAGHRGVPIYLDSGGSGTCVDADGDGIDDDAPDGADNYCENLQLRDTLAAQGYTFDVDLWHWWEPDAEHDEPAWAARVFRPLERFAAL